MTARRSPPVWSPSDVGVRVHRGVVRVGGRVGGGQGRTLELADALAVVRVDLVESADVAPGQLAVVEGRLSGGRIREGHVKEKERHGGLGAEFMRFSVNGVGRALAARALALGVVREWFDGEGFLEVETPLRVPSPGLDAHVDAVPAEGGYLITSPELHMKRLVVGGLPRVYQIARVTRRGEEGPLHEPEFTLVEWYRAFSGIERMIADTETLVASVVRALSGGARARAPSGRAVDVTPPFPRVTVREAFRRHAGVPDAADLAATDEDRYFQTFVDRVEPGLAKSRRALVLHEFPVTQAALARHCPHDPSVAERFEIYAGGVELCNGFGELTCPVEQRARFEREIARRKASGSPAHPIDEPFLAALEEGLPPSGGNALGFDRLVMIALGAAGVKEVIGFPRGA